MKDKNWKLGVCTDGFLFLVVKSLNKYFFFVWVNIKCIFYPAQYPQ